MEKKKKKKRIERGDEFSVDRSKSELYYCCNEDDSLKIFFTVTISCTKTLARNLTHCETFSLLHTLASVSTSKSVIGHKDHQADFDGYRQICCTVILEILVS